MHRFERLEAPMVISVNLPTRFFHLMKIECLYLRSNWQPRVLSTTGMS